MGLIEAISCLRQPVGFHRDPAEDLQLQRLPFNVFYLRVRPPSSWSWVIWNADFKLNEVPQLRPVAGLEAFWSVFERNHPWVAWLCLGNGSLRCCKSSWVHWDTDISDFQMKHGDHSLYLFVRLRVFATAFFIWSKFVVIETRSASSEESLKPEIIDLAFSSHD